MKISRSSILLGFICFGLGLVTMYFGQSAMQHKGYKLRSPLVRDDISMNRPLDDIYDDDFFGRSEKSPDKSHVKMGDAFEQMKRMRESMMTQFDRPEVGGGHFDSWFQKNPGGGDVGQITRHEDEKFVYYEVLVKDLNQEKLNVKVGEGQINISGQTETKSENGSSGTYMSSTFHRSLPIPPNVDAKKIQMENAKDKLIIKFPKIA